MVIAVSVVVVGTVATSSAPVNGERNSPSDSAEWRAVHENNDGGFSTLAAAGSDIWAFGNVGGRGKHWVHHWDGYEWS